MPSKKEQALKHYFIKTGRSKGCWIPWHSNPFKIRHKYNNGWTVNKQRQNNEAKISLGVMSRKYYSPINLIGYNSELYFIVRSIH